MLLLPGMPISKFLMPRMSKPLTYIATITGAGVEHLDIPSGVAYLQSFGVLAITAPFFIN